MQIGQLLKDEKTSIMDLAFKTDVFHGHNPRHYASLQDRVQFFIRNTYLGLKKQLGLRFFVKNNNIDDPTCESEKTNCLRIEIGSDKINALLAQRQICAADIRCLDTSSKQCLKKLCLNSCLYNTTSSTTQPLSYWMI